MAKSAKGNRPAYNVFIVVNRTGDFDGLKISDGSNQFRISAAYQAL